MAQTMQQGKNAKLGLCPNTTFGTESAVTKLLVGWGGPHGSQPETSYSSAAGDAFQQSESSGMIKAAAGFKCDLAFQGYESLLDACFGQVNSAPSGSAATGYTHVFEPGSAGDNNHSVTLSAYEGLADVPPGVILGRSIDRTARSAKVNQWTLDFPKAGGATLDVKFLADLIIHKSTVNTQAVLTALTAVEQAWRYKVKGWHCTKNNTNVGYHRLLPVGAVAITAPKCVTASGNGSGVWTVGTVTTTGKSPILVEKLTLTWTSATAFTYVGSITGATGSGTSGTPFTYTQATNTSVVLTFTKSGTWAASDTTTAWIYYDATGTDQYDISAVSLGDTTNMNFGEIFPNHVKYHWDWHLEGVHGPDRVIYEPYSKQQAEGKVELDFEDDQGTVIDPHGILTLLKGCAYARSEGVPTTDFKLVTLAQSPIFAGTGAGALNYSHMIQCPRLVPMWKDGEISGPGVQAGKYEFHMLKPFSAPSGMSGVTVPIRWTVVNKLSSAPSS